MTSSSDYDARVTEWCERGLVTVIGNAGFWGRHLYLVGGLAPRYFVSTENPTAPAHVGTQDIDLAVVLALDIVNAGEYETLERNLREAGFIQAPRAGDPDFRWRRDGGEVGIILEFLCDTDEVDPGRMFKPRSGSGSRFRALNVRGVRLVATDYSLVEIEADRLNEGGRSKVAVRITGLLPFVVLKAMAFVERHSGKDAYDLVYSLLNYAGGPAVAGLVMAESPAADDPLVSEALTLLAERFSESSNDAPTAYAEFLDVAGDVEARARLRNEAVETVRIALEAFSRNRAR
ncbi:MAG: hypothetical protein ACYC33_09395 [Thermoleophilia bacterium]